MPALRKLAPQDRAVHRTEGLVMATKYEGRVPKSLRQWIEKHAADKVYEVSHGGGFCTDSEGYRYVIARTVRV